MGKLVSFASMAEDIAPLVKALQEVLQEHVAPGTSVVVAAGPGADGSESVRVALGSTSNPVGVEVEERADRSKGFTVSMPYMERCVFSESPRRVVQLKDMWPLFEGVAYLTLDTRRDISEARRSGVDVQIPDVPVPMYGTDAVIPPGPVDRVLADVFLVYLFNFLVRARIRGFGSAVFEVGNTQRPRPVTGLVRYPGTLTACDGKSVADALELVARELARRGVSTRLGSVNVQYGLPRYGGGYFG